MMMSFLGFFFFFGVKEYSPLWQDIKALNWETRKIKNYFVFEDESCVSSVWSELAGSY